MALRVLIPLGGLGERFAAAGYRDPKPLVPVAGRPLLFHLLDRLLVLESNAVDEVCVVYAARLDTDHGFAARVEAAFPSHPRLRLVRLDRETRGAAETVLLGLRAMDSRWAQGRLAVMDGDALYVGDVLDRVAAAQEGSRGLVYFAQDPADAFSGYSYLLLREGSPAEVGGIVEKQRVSEWANTGLAWFGSGAELEAALAELLAGATPSAAMALRVTPSGAKGSGGPVPSEGACRGELYMSLAIAAMLRHGQRFQALRITPSAMVCLGTPAQVAAYEARVRAYLFDLDGTLLDTEETYRSVWRRLMREELDLPDVTDAEADALYDLHVSGNDDATALAGLCPPDSVRSPLGSRVAALSAAKDRLFLAEVSRRQGGGAPPLPGAIEFVRRVRRASADLVAVVSNGNRVVVEALLRAAELAPLCHAVIVGPECARPKPYPDPYEAALRTLGGLRACRAVIFEDSRAGLLSAQAVLPGRLVQVTGAARTPWRFSSAVPAVQDFHDPALAALLVENPAEGAAGGQRVSVCSEGGHGGPGPSASPAALLAAHFPAGTPLRFAETKSKGGFIADVLAVDVGERSKARLVFKYETQDTHSSLAAVAQQLRLHEREYQFYEHVRDAVAARTSLRVPKSWGVVRDPASAAPRGVLLERLEAPAFRLGLDLNREPFGVAARVVERIAEMHARFLGCGEVEFPFLRRADDPLFLPGWGEFVRERWPRFAEKWRRMLTADQLALGAAMAAEFDDVQRALAAGPGLTLIHGDVKSANIFYEGEWKNAERSEGVRRFPERGERAAAPAPSGLDPCGIPGPGRFAASRPGPAGGWPRRRVGQPSAGPPTGGAGGASTSLRLVPRRSEGSPSEGESGGPPEPHFIDWQYIAYGKGAQDLVFFIIESLDEEHIRAWTGPLCDSYHAAYTAGGAELSREQLGRDVRLAVGYFPFFVAMWFGTLRTDELIDVNFPQRFIRRLFAFLDMTQARLIE